MNRNRNLGLLLTALWLATILVTMAGEDAKADATFGKPVDVELTIPVLDGKTDFVGTPSADGLEMYFDSDRAGGHGRLDIWVLRRASPDEDWGEPENLGPSVNAVSYDDWPELSRNGLILYFGSQGRPDGFGGHDLYKTTRVTKNDPWGTPENMGPVLNTSLHEGGPRVSADGLELYFHSKRPGGYGNADIYVSRRETVNDAWGEPENLGPQVNGPYQEGSVVLSPNGLVLFFSGYQSSEPQRAGGYGGSDIWMTQRRSISEPWQKAVNLGPAINTSGQEYTCAFWSDGSKLVYASSWGGWDNWEVPIIPVVDLNTDGKINAQDMSILVDHWHTGDPLCDIAPTPFGDGIVDVEDLKVLSEHLEPGFGRIAHWKLDEEEGTVAYDSIGGDHANVHGEAVWQPEAGYDSGAQALDGVDDYAAPMTILDPADKPFRILTWIKGGAPGQVIASQTPTEFMPGGTYLAADATDGTLMTESVLPVPLKSGAVITDGEWHRVGLEWDGERRHLLVNDNEVAVDAITLPGVDNTGYLNIGTGKAFEDGTFWSGLIDDVRVYVKGQ